MPRQPTTPGQRRTPGNATVPSLGIPRWSTGQRPCSIPSPPYLSVGPQGGHKATVSVRLGTHGDSRRARAQTTRRQVLQHAFYSPIEPRREEGGDYRAFPSVLAPSASVRDTRNKRGGGLVKVFCY